MTFELVKQKLVEAKVPCLLKQTEDNEFVIELGMWYPDVLADSVFSALDGVKMSVCADSTIRGIRQENVLGGRKRW